MARKKYNELAAGIFVLLAIGALVGVIVWLGGANILKPTGQKAMFFADEETGSLGLEKGNFVQVGDDQVGKITKIRFDPASKRTYYTAEIERGDFKIHSDGEARVAAALIGGARLVIVNRGTETEPLADENHPIKLEGGLDQAIMKLNETIQRELNTDDPEAILSKVYVIIDSLKTIAANVLKETDAETEGSSLAKVHKSLDDVNKATGDIQEMAAKVRPDVEKAVAAVKDTAEQIRTYAKKDLADILANLREVNTRILKIASNFVTVSEQTRQIMLVNRTNIDELIDNMTQVSADLKATAKEVRRNPWRLLYQPDDKELHSQNIYDAATAFYSGAEQLDQAITKLNALAKAYPEGIPADDPELLKIRKQVEKSFSKFSKAEQALWGEMTK